MLFLEDIHKKNPQAYWTMMRQLFKRARYVTRLLLSSSSDTCYSNGEKIIDVKEQVEVARLTLNIKGMKTTFSDDDEE